MRLKMNHSGWNSLKHAVLLSFNRGAVDRLQDFHFPTATSLYRRLEIPGWYEQRAGKERRSGKTEEEAIPSVMLAHENHDIRREDRAQVADAERTLAFNVGQQFVSVLLAESTLAFALDDLKGFQQTVDISEAQLKAGYIGEGDYLKIKLQLLQFQTDVSSARLAKVQALVGLREFLGYNAVTADFDVVGELEFQPLKGNLEDLQARALRERPDFRAAELGITAAQSQILLAKANAKVDVNGTYDFTHVSGENTASLFANFELPIFNRNQGEIARTGYALTQAQEQQQSSSDTVLSDVANAYEAVRSNEEVVQLYTSGYLKQAQDSRDISEYAYKRGAASLLDYLDAERSYRSVQLAYRQALASYLTALEQLKEAEGTRNSP